ncbi:hypothetical protein ACFE04_010971 [Oxalis oulophora]
MENISGQTKEGSINKMDLPPGFRFHPTDEELITHYLSQKVLDSCFCARAIGEVDLNKCEPWDLPWRAKMGEKEWYFFCVRDRKYPTGLRTNRATDAGYWKATGKDKEIYKAKQLVGMKKTLVFYKGRAPKGEKTNWVMHEYRLEGKYSIYNLPKTAKNEWVICRVFQKSSNGKKIHISGISRLTSYSNDLRPSSLLPPLIDHSSSQYNNDPRTNNIRHVACFSDPTENQKPKINNFNNTTTSFFPSSSSINMSQPMTYTKNPLTNTFYINQIAPNIGNLQYNDPVLMQDQSILRLLLENQGSNPKGNLKADYSAETDMSSAVSNHENVQDDPSTSDGPVDLDSLWNY